MSHVGSPLRNVQHSLCTQHEHFTHCTHFSPGLASCHHRPQTKHSESSAIIWAGPMVFFPVGFFFNIALVDLDIWYFFFAIFAGLGSLNSPRLLSKECLYGLLVMISE